MRLHWWRLALIGGLICLAGCASAVPLTETPPPIPVTLTAPAVTPTPTPTLQPSSVALTLWTPDFLDPYAETSGAAPLAEQIVEFTRQNRDVQVQVLVKKAEGAGGLYNLLSTAAAAVPEVLPDVVILDETDLRLIAAENVGQPLAEWIGWETSYYPFVRAAVRREGQVVGEPYLVNVQQMVYEPAVSASAPLSWTAVLTGGYTLLLPGAPLDGLGDEVLLALYLGTEGVLLDEAGRPILERNRLEDLYRFLDTLIEAGLLQPEVVLNLPDAAACWSAYQQELGTLSLVAAGEYWAAPERIGAPVWLPTPRGHPVAMGHVWSLVMITDDPNRQAAAQRLIRWLTAADQVNTLAASVKMLPASRDALSLWNLNAYEFEFVSGLLEVAILPETDSIDQAARRALQAGFALLLQEPETTPAEAATLALTILRR